MSKSITTMCHANCAMSPLRVRPFRTWSGLALLTLQLSCAFGLWRSDFGDLLPFPTFTQNLAQGGAVKYDNWFGVSWTLATKDWFYLALPLVLWRLGRFRIGSVVIGLVILLVVLGRSGRYVRHFPARSIAMKSNSPRHGRPGPPDSLGEPGRP